MIARLFTLSILLVITQKLNAELTKEHYQQEVAAYSWELKGAQNTIESSDGTLSLKRTLRLPELLATGRFYYHLRDANGAKQWSSAIAPELVQTIYGGGVIEAEIEIAKIAQKSAICSAEFTLLEVLYAADYAYWNYWATECYNNAMKRYVTLIEREAQAIRLRTKEGYTSKGDLLMIESRLSEAQYELISSEQTMIIALNNLNILRGIEPTTPTALSYAKQIISQDGERQLTTITLPARVPIEQVIAQRPDYSASQLSQLSAEAATRVVRGGYAPQIKGGIRGSWANLTPNITGETEINGTAFIELSIPIYHFSQRNKASLVSKIAERQSEITTAKLRDQIITQESSAWVTLIESRAQVEAASRSLLIANENLAISTFAYNEGEVSIVDLMQAQISWIQIYTNAIDSEYNFRLAEAAYSKAVGNITLKR